MYYYYIRVLLLLYVFFDYIDMMSLPLVINTWDFSNATAKGKLITHVITYVKIENRCGNLKN